MDNIAKNKEARKEYMRKYYIKRKEQGFVKCSIKSKKKQMNSLTIKRGTFIVRFD
tara:strand:- start:1413 stop:1577 length:165 start_codon:yes stop_codon:yes gene_type:complete